MRVNTVCTWLTYPGTIIVLTLVPVTRIPWITSGVAKRSVTGRFAALLDSQQCELAVLGNIGFTRSLIEVAVDRSIPIATDLHQIDEINGHR